MHRRVLAVVAVATTTIGVSALSDSTPSVSAAVQVETVFNSQYNLTRTMSSRTAACPAGSEVYGGGAQIVGGDGDVMVTLLQPWRAGSSSGYSATAEELGDPLDGAGTPWTLVAYAICGNGLTGTEHVTASQTLATSGSLTVIAACPSGKVLVGTGAAVGSPSVLLDGIRPINAGRSLQVTAVRGFWATWYRPVPNDVVLTSFAVCADPPAGWSIEVAGSQPRPADPQGKTVDCGPNRVVLGGGLTSFHGNLPGWYTIWAFFPQSTAANNPPTTFTVRMGSPLPFASNAWANAAWAICAAL